MDLTCEERPSDSPFVERIWRDAAGDRQPINFISIAEHHWSMVVTKFQGQTILTVRGPETQATPAHDPGGAEHFGIMFKLGAFMPHLPVSRVMDRQDVKLPGANSQKFWLQGAAWEFPDFENADTFVERLVRDDLLVQEPVVNTTLQGAVPDVSLRSVQRRVLQSTGLSHMSLYQIERARFATTRLKQGVPILDVVDEAGYADQPHLTRALKRYTGQTPAQIISASRPNPLSFLFKTEPF